MYQTNITNSINSAAKARSFVPFQKDLWENEGHNRDHLIIVQVMDFYHQSLKSQPRLSEMLTRRKIHPNFIDQFKIGFADRTLGFELQSPKCLLGSQNRGNLQRLGLLKDSGHEFFRGSLVIPFQDGNGQIAGAYGRRPRNQRRNQTYHLYWNTQQVDFFNATRMPLPDSLILCKSALDALTLLSAGIVNTVATMGVQGFNDIQLSRLVDDRVRRVCIAFDNTPAANRYALLIAQALDAVNIACCRVHLPVGHDVNRFAMQQTDVTGAFNRLLDSAAPFKQRYGQLVPQAEAHWLKQLISIQDCVAFYLEEQRHGGKASRTLNTARIHLERFRDYCHSDGVEQIADINSEVLEAYQQYLVWEKNVFTGKVISLTTQMERMDSVARMLSRLHYYGIIPEPLAFTTPSGSVH
jgi:hypothetical protein